jgi:hypothetical protein
MSAQTIVVIRQVVVNTQTIPILVAMVTLALLEIVAVAVLVSRAVL